MPCYSDYTICIIAINQYIRPTLHAHHLFIYFRKLTNYFKTTQPLSLSLSFSSLRVSWPTNKLIMTFFNTDVTTCIYTHVTCCALVMSWWPHTSTAITKRSKTGLLNYEFIQKWSCLIKLKQVAAPCQSSNNPRKTHTHTDGTSVYQTRAAVAIVSDTNGYIYYFPIFVFTKSSGLNYLLLWLKKEQIYLFICTYIILKQLLVGSTVHPCPFPRTLGDKR